MRKGSLNGHFSVKVQSISLSRHWDRKHKLFCWNCWHLMGCCFIFEAIHFMAWIQSEWAVLSERNRLLCLCLPCLLSPSSCPQGPEDCGCQLPDGAWRSPRIRSDLQPTKIRFSEKMPALEGGIYAVRPCWGCSFPKALEPSPKCSGIFWSGVGNSIGDSPHRFTMSWGRDINMEKGNRQHFHPLH